MKTFKLSLFQTIVCLILLLTLADSRKSIGIDPKYQQELEELERQSARYDRMTKNKLAETDDQVIVLEKKRSRKEEHEELKIYEKYFLEAFLTFVAIAFIKAGVMFWQNISWDEELKLKIIENRLGYVFGFINYGHDPDAPYDFGIGTDKEIIDKMVQ